MFGSDFELFLLMHTLHTAPWMWSSDNSVKSFSEVLERALQFSSAHFKIQSLAKCYFSLNSSLLKMFLLNAEYCIVTSTWYSPLLHVLRNVSFLRFLPVENSIRLSFCVWNLSWSLRSVCYRISMLKGTLDLSRELDIVLMQAKCATVE